MCALVDRGRMEQELDVDVGEEDVQCDWVVLY